jgi:hypothetical protein
MSAFVVLIARNRRATEEPARTDVDMESNKDLK